MNDIIVFEYFENYHNKGGYGKLVNKIRGFRNHYASTLMFKLSALGYKESHRYNEIKIVEKWGSKFDAKIVRCVWYKDTIVEGE